MAKDNVRPLQDRNFAEEMERLIAEARGEISALSRTQEDGEGTDHEPNFKAAKSPSEALSPVAMAAPPADDSVGLQGSSPEQPSPNERKSTLPTPPGATSPELTSALMRIEEKLASYQAALGELSRIRALLEEADKTERAHEKLFSALHEELKSYKDGFLFDALQKPFIKDLLSLHDDIAGAGRRIAEARDAFASGRLTDAAVLEALDLASENFANLMHFLVEILTRLDVVKRPPSEGPADIEAHRVISIQPTDQPEWDGEIAESVRPGFRWRDRVLRPEDVVIFRCTGGGNHEPGPAQEPL